MKKFALLLSLFLCLPLAQGFGQLGVPGSDKTQTFTISATVLSALTITKNSDLLFGGVYQGTTQSILPNGTPTYAAGSTQSAASLQISGAGSREVIMQFTGHTTLANGSNNLTVSYTSTDAVFVEGTAGPSGGATWDPTSATHTDNLDATGVATVYLGGTVSPGSALATGTYSATATLTVGYTGN